MSLRSIARHLGLGILSWLIGLGIFIVPTIYVPTANAQQESHIEALGPGDFQFMDKQRASIDALARRHFGKRIRQQIQNDIEVLQALLDQNIVRSDQTLLLQAMGLVLGDLYVKQLGVHWVIYRDQFGRSRALQWHRDDHLLFPITMVSRRARVGIKVNMVQLHSKGLGILEPIVKGSGVKGSGVKYHGMKSSGSRLY